MKTGINRRRNGFSPVQNEESLHKEASIHENKYHNLSPEQWQWAVQMIKEFELNEDGAKILIDEIKKGNFVFD